MNKKKNVSLFKKNPTMRAKMKKLVFICSFLTVAVVVLGLVTSIFIAKSYQNLTVETLATQVGMAAEVVETSMVDSGALLKATSKVFAMETDLTVEDIFQSLRNLKNSGLYDEVYYVTCDGYIYISNGILRYIDATILNENIDPNKDITFYVEQFLDVGNRDYYKMLSPVIIKGMLAGYLVAERDNTTLLKSIKNNFYDLFIDTYLMDSEGDIFVSSDNGNYETEVGRNFYNILRERLLDETEGDIYELQLKDSISTGNVGVMDAKCKAGNAKLFYCEVPGSDGCAVLYAANMDDFAQYKKTLTVGVILFNVLLILIVVITVYLIWTTSFNDMLEMEKLIYEDGLTGAPNENHFMVRAEEILREYPDIPYSIVSFDILNFRYINEAYGHDKADTILKTLAEICREMFAYNETFARVGADRFVSLSINDDRGATRIEFIEDRLKKVADNIFVNYPLRVKRGVYHVNDRKELLSEMIDKANLARKNIDNTVKDLHQEYRDDLMDETRKVENIESKMHRALEDGEFIPFLQPKWNMKENHICGAEALIRWRKKDGSLVSPGEFIPVFEKNGFIEKVDFYMFEKICQYLRQMLDEGRPVYPVSINQSRYLLHDIDYTKNVHDILVKYKIPKGLIELELTETVFFQEQDRMIEVMNELKRQNLEISIDDFGSGYSSLNLIRTIPFDVIKIDRAFLDQTCSSESGKLVLRKIVELAEGLGVRVICEGVETVEQKEMLLEIGCIYAQGFFYSRPIPIDDFIEKYEAI